MSSGQTGRFRGVPRIFGGGGGGGDPHTGARERFFSWGGKSVDMPSDCQILGGGPQAYIHPIETKSWGGNCPPLPPPPPAPAPLPTQANKPNKHATELKPYARTCVGPCVHQGSLFTRSQWRIHAGGWGGGLGGLSHPSLLLVSIWKFSRTCT